VRESVVSGIEIVRQERSTTFPSKLARGCMGA
jgi:hypothetical protein